MIAPLLLEPQAFIIDEEEDSLGVLLTLHVNQKDMGTVIGHDGETIKAIKILTRIFGNRRSKRISIRVVEPDGKPYKHLAPTA